MTEGRGNSLPGTLKRDGEQSLKGGSLTARQPRELPRAAVTVSSTRLW